MKNSTGMAENLKVTKYRNGDNITHITDNPDWSDNTTGAYGDYEDNTTYSDTYGRLYNWYALDNSSGRYICPEGWHMPTKDEYDVLRTFLGGTSVAGGKLKETGTEHWSNPNSVSDNASGITTLNLSSISYSLIICLILSIARYEYELLKDQKRSTVSDI